MLEQQLATLYESLNALSGVPRLKASKAINRLEQTLSWQGANPKKLPFKELKEHIQAPIHDDSVDNKYQAKIRSRATAIRAFCVQCQGGYTPGVKECASMTCPLHSFRMGNDPLRGYEMPVAAVIELEDDADDALFEDGEGEDDKDATE